MKIICQHSQYFSVIIIFFFFLFINSVFFTFVGLFSSFTSQNNSYLQSTSLFFLSFFSSRLLFFYWTMPRHSCVFCLFAFADFQVRPAHLQASLEFEFSFGADLECSVEGYLSDL